MRKLTPLGLTLLSFFIFSTSFAAGILAGATGENPDRGFLPHDKPGTATMEIWFPELYGQGGAGIGNDTEFRVATLVGSERAVTVLCPAHFTPDLSRVYLASVHRFKTLDGRLAPPVWTLLVDLDGRAILPR